MKAYLKPTTKLYRMGSSASTSKTKMKNKRLSTLYSDWGRPLGVSQNCKIGTKVVEYL